MRKWINIVETERLPRGFRVYRMPKGTTVYHGTSGMFAAHHLESPCWVSTSFDVAERFSNWHENESKTDDDYEEDEQGIRILEFKTTTVLRLLYVESRDTFDKLEDRYGFSMQTPNDMADAVCQLGYDGWYIENNYIDGDDTLLCDSSILQFVAVHR